MAHSPPQFLVVGIGASAGGIAALQEFFALTPTNSGCAYVVILHLSPEYEHNLAVILQAVTFLPVTQVTERVRVEPNHIYVVPPSKHLIMADGELVVAPNTLPAQRRAPVDIFFRTLADSHTDHAVCVILSGTGADGSMGLKRVKERGGAVFVQSPREAAFAEMPRSAIATDLVDDVLPVAAIPARLVAYAVSLDAVSIAEEPEQRPEAQQQALREIFAQLRLRTGYDFATYKRSTLLRRIERRISVCSLPDLEAYASFLHSHPDEGDALLNDLLSSVTNFFRDRQAFAALEQDVLPQLFQGKGPDAQVRIWVVGCATGEEAYSVAMLCAERTSDAADAPSVQIFATDINEAALAQARNGLYSAVDIADISAERLRRFFTFEDGRYRARRELRERILFANHNVLTDSPFAHLDLVACRNLLISLDRSAQERVLETFHAALDPGGYLFLGNAETADSTTDLFATLSHEQRLFQRRQNASRSLTVPEVRLTPRIALPPLEGSESVREPINSDELHQRLLEQYAPLSLVVDQEYAIVHLSERAGRYLQFAAGEPSANLLTLVRPELRGPLHTALSQALQRQTNIEARDLPVRIGQRTEQITLQVRPVLRHDDPAQGYLLVLFESGAAKPGAPKPVAQADEAASQQLDEVQRLKLQLRTTSEQYEYQAEELRAANEELRASSEELHASKEELQSTVEELRTVNQELKVRIEDATLTSANLQNLVNATDIGTIFLDRGLRVKLFTPLARSLFNLIPADYGRPLSDLTHQLGNVDVLADAETVFATLQPVEREVRTTDGRVFVLRVLPYRAAEDRIRGVVLTFFDITARKRAEQAARDTQERLEAALTTARMATWNWDPAADQVTASETMVELFGLLPGQRWQSSAQDFHLVHPDDVGRHQALVEAARRAGDSWHSEFRILRPRDGQVAWLEERASTSHDPETGATRITGLIWDITERKRMEEALRESESVFRLIFEGSSVGKAQTDLVTRRFLRVNAALCAITGYNEAELLALTVDELTHSDDRKRDREQFERLVQGKASYELEKRYVRKDGRLVWVAVTGNLIQDAEGQNVRVVAVIQDITERKHAQEALRISEAKYRTLFETMDEGFCILQLLFDAEQRPIDYRYIEVNPAFERQTGMHNARGRTIRELVPDIEGFWVDSYGRVALTGKPTYFVDHARSLGRWFDVHAFRIGDPEERRVAVLFTDITERKRREAQLAFLAEVGEEFARLSGAEEMIQAVGAKIGAYLQVSTCVFVDVDEARGELTVNDAWNSANAPSLLRTFRIAEYLSDEFARASRAGEMVVVRDTQSDARTDAQAYAALEVRAFVTVPIHRNSEWKYYLGVTDQRPRNWRDDELELIEDLSNRIFPRLERARAEARLQELYVQEQAARAQAEEASRLKDEFLATVSHELRTPLTAFLGYAQLLQRRRRDEAYVSRTVEKMVRSAEAQAELIEDLLDVSRVVSGKLRIEPEPIDLRDVIQAAFDTVRPAVEAKELQVQLELDPAAGAVVGDPHRLQQVIWNLLSNAAKFTPPDGQIVVRLAPAGGSAELSVHDSGQGIPPEFLPYVFERFRQADSSSQRAHGGLGLGLTIVRHLVELHGGTAEATSAGIGQGATFTVRLPLVKASDPTSHTRATPFDDAKPDAGQRPLRGLRVLVVDDQPTVLELLAEILSTEGATVQACATAQEALVLVRTWLPDVLVSDVAMPEKDGYWLIRQVRGLLPEEGGAIPAVALTAYVRMEDRLQVLAAGFEQYVPKPVDADELREVILRLSSKSLES